MSRVQRNVTQTYTTSNVPAGYTTTTSNYAPVVTTTASNVYAANSQPAYYTSGQTYTSGQVATGNTGAYYTAGTTGATQQYYTTTTTGGAVGRYAVAGGAHKVVAEEIPVESRIEYIPFEKKYVEYEQIEKIYQVPFEIEVTEYEQVVRNERIPIERTITDYYAVETQVEYIRREIEQTIMVDEPVQKIYERVQYIPVETQIVHYPQRDNYVPAKTQMRTQYVGVVEGGQVQRGQQGSTIQTVTKVVEGTGSRVGGSYVASGSGAGYVTHSGYPGNATYTTTNTGYVAQPVTTTQYVTGGNTGYVTGSNTQYVTGGNTQYVSGGNTGYVTTTTTGGVPAGYNTGYANTTGYVTTTGQNVTGTTGYVTGGSGVRGGYVTGGSGVRGASYVPSGSNIKQSSYETTTGYY